jgi:HlyD family secretion protein
VAVTVILTSAALVRLEWGAERTVRLPEAELTVVTVKRGTFHDTIPVRGKVVALNTVDVDALDGGHVEKILVQAGDTVTAGQPLAELSNTQLQLSVLDREARLIESMTQLRTYETQLEQTSRENKRALAAIDYEVARLTRAMERRGPLVADGAEPAELLERDQDELQYQHRLRAIQDASDRILSGVGAVQLAPIRTQMGKLEEDLQLTRHTLDQLTVRAAVSGALTSMTLKVGQTLSAGERFAEITQDTGFKVSAPVDEYYLGEVRTGQPAQIEHAGTRWKLHVMRVYPQVTNGTFTIDLQFDGAQPAGLLPGQALQGELTLGVDAVATIIPTGAFLDRTGGTWIFVVSQDGKGAERRSIRLGRRSARQLQVLGGLKEGEKVIISSYAGLERTERVAFRK